MHLSRLGYSNFGAMLQFGHIQGARTTPPRARADDAHLHRSPSENWAFRALPAAMARIFMR